MNTKQVCQRFSVTPKMLRIYEEKGLLMPERGENNYRDYSAKDLLRLQAIVTLRQLEFSTGEIFKILERADDRKENIDAMYFQLKAVEMKMDHLAEIRNRLRRAVNEIIDAQHDDDFITKVTEAGREWTPQNEQYDNLIRQWDFDEMASEYISRYLKTDKSYEAAILDLRAWLKETPADARIIDVGCGTCNLWQGMGRKFHLTAMDNSLMMLKEARKKTPWAEYYLDDLTTMDVHDYGQFDIVVSTFMMHHISRNDHHTAIDNMLDLCKEDGVLVISDRSYENHQDRLAAEQKLEKEGDLEQLKNVRSEHFIYIDDMKRYLEYRNCDMEYKKIADHVYRYMVHKRGSNRTW